MATTCAGVLDSGPTRGAVQPMLRRPARHRDFQKRVVWGVSHALTVERAPQAARGRFAAEVSSREAAAVTSEAAMHYFLAAAGGRTRSRACMCLRTVQNKLTTSTRLHMSALAGLALPMLPRSSRSNRTEGSATPHECRARKEVASAPALPSLARRPTSTAWTSRAGRDVCPQRTPLGLIDFHNNRWAVCEADDRRDNFDTRVQ